MNNYTVYMHVNKINHKVYVGQTCQQLNKRWKNGYGYQTGYFSSAIKHYGWCNFEHIILAENLTAEQADETEKSFIELYKSNTKEFGYNLDNGGHSNKCHSEETKRKIGISRSKPIYCIELDRTFNSISQAARELNLKLGNIGSCLTGRRLTCGGYHWRYV